MPGRGPELEIRARVFNRPIPSFRRAVEAGAAASMRRKRPLARRLADRRLPSARADSVPCTRPQSCREHRGGPESPDGATVVDGSLHSSLSSSWPFVSEPAAKARSGFQFNQASTQAGKAPSPSCSHRGAVQRHCARRASIECHQRRGERKRRQRRPCQIAAARHTHSEWLTVLRWQRSARRGFAPSVPTAQRRRPRPRPMPRPWPADSRRSTCT